MNSEIAEKTSLLALKIGADLNQHLVDIQETCSETEFTQYQQATGKVLGEILVGFLNPIYQEQPSLKPQEMGGEYEV
jgi:hypothetical protein